MNSFACILTFLVIFLVLILFHTFFILFKNLSKVAQGTVYNNDS